MSLFKCIPLILWTFCHHFMCIQLYMLEILFCYNLAFYSINQKLHTHSSFEGIHVTSKRLYLASVFIGVLLGQPQSFIISGCSLGEVSKLVVTWTNGQTERRNRQWEGQKRGISCSINDESETVGEAMWLMHEVCKLWKMWQWQRITGSLVVSNDTISQWKSNNLLLCPRLFV